MNIKHLVAQLVELDLDVYFDEFNELMYEIQSLLGQEDGGLAGVMFSDDLRWNKGSKDERLDMVQNYLDAEVRELINIYKEVQ